MEVPELHRYDTRESRRRKIQNRLVSQESHIAQGGTSNCLPKGTHATSTSPKADHTGCGLSDMPQEVVEEILKWMAPLELLRFRMVNRYLRSIVKQYRAQRSSQPWLLLNVNAPFRVSLKDKEWRKAKQYPFCWALEPETMRWMQLRLPVISNEGKSWEDPVKVDSTGSSGLVVVWRSPGLSLVVGNLMTQKWQTVAGNSKYGSKDKDRKDHFEQECFFATHLVLDEKKEKALKLVHFRWRGSIHILGKSANGKTLYAHSYCFSSKKWDEDFPGVPEIAIPPENNYPGKLMRVHDTICTHDGIVFILISEPSFKRYLVLSYCVALGEFAIALPWTQIAHFTCTWKHVVLTFNQDENFLLQSDSGTVATSPSWTLGEESDESQAAVWMKGLAKGLQLLVAQEAMIDGVRGSEIQVLTHDPYVGAWIPPFKDRYEPASSKAWKRARLQEAVCDFCKKPSRSKLIVSFQMVRSGHKSLFVAAYHDYCTQIGCYDMATGLVKRVRTPLLPADLHCEMKPASFWSKFTMQCFHPSFADCS